ncbi:MAG TPA: hypothetical protein VF820_00495, partial [Patescibacteria group bacterium]
VSAINEDLGRHIISGELTLTTRHVISINFFSFTNSSYPFVNVYWLSEVIFYLIYIHAGFFGLLLLTILFAIFSWFILVLPFIKQKAIIPILFSSLILLGIFLLRTEVRPEIFSYFFLSIFTTLLFYFRRKYTLLLFILIPCTLLWANLHIYFVLGLGLLSFYSLDTLFYERKNLLLWIKFPKTIPASAKIIFLTTIFSFVISLLNPYGIKLLLYPFFITNHLSYVPLELQNTFSIEPYILAPSILFFKFSFILTFIFLLFNRKRVFLSDWLITIAFTILGIQALRNLNLYAIAIFPIITSQLIFFYKNVLFNKVEKIKSFFRITKSVLILGIIILFFYINSYAISSRGFGYSTPTGVKNAVNFVEKEHISGPFFNNFDIGSYLIFRFYPKYKVFIDNRAEAYSQGFIENIYIPMGENQKYFNQITQAYNIQAAIITHVDETNIVDQLIKNNEWALVYLDDYAAVFLKNSPENKLLIQKFLITEYTFNKTYLNNKSITQLQDYANFFTKEKWKNLEIYAYQKMLVRNPTNCDALGQLMQLLPQNMAYSQSYRYTCQ